MYIINAMESRVVRMFNKNVNFNFLTNSFFIYNGRKVKEVEGEVKGGVWKIL